MIEVEGEQYLTGREVVRRFGVSEPTVRKRRDRGDLPSFSHPMHDGAVLYRVRDIERMFRPVPREPKALREEVAQ